MHFELILQQANAQRTTNGLVDGSHAENSVVCFVIVRFGTATDNNDVDTTVICNILLNNGG